MDYPVLDKIPVFPLIKNFKADTVFNAFLLAGIFNAVLLSMTLATKKIVDKNKVNDFWKWAISFIYIFVITVICYTGMYLIFGFGGGMLIQN